MMKVTIALYLCLATAQGFVAPSVNTRPSQVAASSSSLNALTDLATMIPSVVPSELPITSNVIPEDITEAVAEEISLTVEAVSENSPALVPELTEKLLPAPLFNFIFGEQTEEIIEEEVANGMSHALLDFGTFWSENAWLIKFLTVVGRIVVLTQTLAPGQQVMADELFFQLGLLGFSCHSLYQATGPKLEARKASLLMTSKDRLAFRTIFRSAGFSWQQFREIHLQSMNWVTMEPGQVIEDDAVFWLYRGEVQIKDEDDEIMHTISCQDERSGMGLVGEKHFSYLLDNRSAAMQKEEQKNASVKSHVAGADGATMLRIDIPKLGRFLRHHDELTNNFGRLAFSAMQDKIKALRTKEVVEEVVAN